MFSRNLSEKIEVGEKSRGLARELDFRDTHGCGQTRYDCPYYERRASNGHFCSGASFAQRA
jgi:hypothetical protein